MRLPSLRWRLFLLVALPVMLLWVAAGAWLVQRTAHETSEMFDRELERTAASVLAVMASMPERGPGAAAFILPKQKLEQRPEIVVRDRRGRILIDASSLPVVAVDGRQPAFATLNEHGESWRVYQRWDSGQRYWIQVAAPLHDREQLLAAHLQALLIPAVALPLLLLATIWFGLWRGLAPLRSLSRAIGARPARTPKLTRDDVPRELRQLTHALDALVSGLDAALARERRFTADAAHELRHPLAVLQMELDLAAVAAGEAERRAHLERASAGLTRMERLVAQLLTLARVESLDTIADAQRLDAAALAQSVVAEAGERAAPHGVRLTLEAQAPSYVQASPGLLEIALRNLVDNAIQHGKPAGEVTVSVAREGNRVEIAVRDDGPGFPPQQAQRLGERFLRGQASEGSGLGLSIVQVIAALHGGSVQIAGASGGGARVALVVPAATQPQANR